MGEPQHLAGHVVHLVNAAAKYIADGKPERAADVLKHAFYWAGYIERTKRRAKA